MNSKLILNILLFHISFLLSLNVYSQSKSIRNIPLVIDQNNLSIDELLNKIESITNITLTYSPDQLDKTIKYKTQDKNSTLGNYLDIIETSQKLKIIINENHVYLVKNNSPVNNNSKNISFSGFVKDYDTGEILIGASISGKNSQYGQLSDENGYFNIKTIDSIESYIISYVGYNSFEISKTDLTRDFQGSFLLKKNILLDEVIIKDQQNKGDLGLFEFSRIKSTFEITDDKAGVRGNDLFEQLKSLPGIEKVNDFQGGVSINGLASSDNIYLLDGARIYEPNHIFGLFSTFNSTSINKVSLYTNFIPSKYSGVLSAIIDNHLKEGNFKKHSFIFDITSTDLGLHLTGPVIKYKTSYILDIRKSIFGTYIPNLIRNQIDLDFNKIDFYDINVKLTHRIGQGNKINLFFYSGNDKIIINNDFEEEIKSENNFKWNNRALGIKWYYLISNNFKSEFSLSMSNYFNNSFSGFELNNTLIENKYLYVLSQTDLRDITFRQEFSYYFPRSIFRFGYNASKYNILPALKGNISDISEVPDLQIESEVDSTYNNDVIHASYEYNGISRLKILFGLQFGIYRKNSFTDNYFHPQAMISYKLGNYSYLDISYMQSSKFIHSLGSYSIGIPSMLWIGAEKSIPMSKVDNYSLNYIFEKTDFGFRIELYYKRLKDIIQFKDLTDLYNPISSKGVVVPLFNTSSSLSNDIIKGSGIAYGLNLNSTFKFSKIYTNISFSINRNFLNFDNIDSGNQFNGKYDILYSNGLYLKYVNSNYKIFVGWHFHSGQVFTYPEYIYQTNGGDEILDYSLRNNRRMKNYQSLSLGFEYNINTDRADWTLSVGINNIYNHFNPVYVYLYKSDDVFKASQISGIPVFPYFKVQSKF